MLNFVKLFCRLGFSWLAIVFVAGCENDLKEVKRLSYQGKTGIERADTIEILYSDSAVVRVRILAPLMFIHLGIENPHREFPNGIHVDFFDRYKQPTSFLTAKKAYHYEKQGRVDLKDSVCVWNTKQERLETSELFWDERAERIYSNKNVKISTPTETIYGKGFRSNVDFTDWQIDSVSGIIRADKLIDEKELLD